MRLSKFDEAGIKIKYVQNTCTQSPNGGKDWYSRARILFYDQTDFVFAALSLKDRLQLDPLGSLHNQRRFLEAVDNLSKFTLKKYNNLFVLQAENPDTLSSVLGWSDGFKHLIFTSNDKTNWNFIGLSGQPPEVRDDTYFSKVIKNTSGSADLNKVDYKRKILSAGFIFETEKTDEKYEFYYIDYELLDSKVIKRIYYRTFDFSDAFRFPYPEIPERNIDDTKMMVINRGSFNRDEVKLLQDYLSSNDQIID